MSEILQIGKLNNCYLIVGSGGSVLVDTGPRSARDAVYKKVKDRNVKLIVLTHGHHDHIANAAYLCAQLQVPIAMHPGDVALIENQSARPLMADHFIGKMIKFMSGILVRQSPMEPFEPSVSLVQGFSLEPYGVAGVICELPGHTKGSIGILVDDDTLLAGDALMNMLGSPASKLFEDKELMLRSMSEIRKMPVSKIYVGHGSRIKQ